MEGRRDVAEQNQKKKPEMWALLRPEADDDNAEQQHEDKQEEQTQENKEPQQQEQG